MVLFGDQVGSVKTTDVAAGFGCICARVCMHTRSVLPLGSSGGGCETLLRLCVSPMCDGCSAVARSATERPTCLLGVHACGSIFSACVISCLSHPDSDRVGGRPPWLWRWERVGNSF